MTRWTVYGPEWQRLGRVMARNERIAMVAADMLFGWAVACHVEPEEDEQ